MISENFGHFQHSRDTQTTGNELPGRCKSAWHALRGNRDPLDI
jgi:hypothetical protein